MTEASVVIPAYGHCPHLPGLIRALIDDSKAPAQIIVSHSGSHNPTEDIARVSEAVTVLHEPARLFAGAARNRGAAVAKGAWFAFIDADVRPRPDWLQALLQAAGQSPDRFIVGSVGYATTGGYWGLCNWLCEFSEQAPWHPARRQAGGASCNMIVRADDFRAAGGFPDALRASEDTLLFARLRAIGKAQWFAPEARVDHYNLKGLGAFARHQYRMGYYSALVRQQAALRGSVATRFWPLALGLWIPRLVLIGRRIAGASPAWWLRGIGLAPGLVLGSWIWTLGFLGRLVSSSRDRSTSTANAAERPQVRS